MLQIVRNNFEVFVSRTRASRRQLVRPTCIYAARSLSRCTDLRDAPSLSPPLSLSLSDSRIYYLFREYRGRLCVRIPCTWIEEIRWPMIEISSATRCIQERNENEGKKFLVTFFSSTVRLNFATCQKATSQKWNWNV